MAYSRTITRRNAAPKPTSQPSGVPPRTIPLTLSVTEPRLWPGSMTGGKSRSMKLVGSVSRLIALLAAKHRVGIAHRREVRRPRAGVQLAQQGVVARVGLQSGDLAVGVVEVAEHDRARRAGRLAGGEHFAVGDPAPLLLGFDAGVGD